MDTTRTISKEVFATELIRVTLLLLLIVLLRVLLPLLLMPIVSYEFYPVFERHQWLIVNLVVAFGFLALARKQRAISIPVFLLAVASPLMAGILYLIYIVRKRS
ncbi:hypothetical protein [Chryseolinea lacunae]|uniref:Uncharacterized protein n=1 Tax=Chryseolinea lacunae TaxID=2801331 RepID=A0ABS1KNQ5_9BACT|nr:hypothetical protein [Chryseolinea lacunae]MBL0741090.1 hypothetical protein [Chryseolinea lacunae]